MTVTCTWRGDFANGELESLHAEAFERAELEYDWRAQVERHSLGWVVARDGGALAGFVNVAWDGGVHAWVIDLIVPVALRRRGIARQLVAVVVEEARAAGCEWLHVDFEDHLRPLYLAACGFTPTNAGLIAL